MPGHRTFPSCRNFVIPKEYQGCIIGKEGSIVKDIQITTATTISIRDHKDPKKCTVRITGTSNGTRAAEKRVRQVMEEHNEHAKREEEILKLNMWKKSFGLNSNGNILLKVWLSDSVLRVMRDVELSKPSFERIKLRFEVV